MNHEPCIMIIYIYVVNFRIGEKRMHSTKFQRSNEGFVGSPGGVLKSVQNQLHIADLVWMKRIDKALRILNIYYS